MTGITRRSIRPGLFGVLLALLAVGAVSRLRAEVQANEAGVESPIVYRRIYVPADDLSVWPLGGKKYLPVETRDFEAWVAAANRAAASGPPAATITEAVYTARLDGGRLVNGRGEWTIAFAGGEPVLVPLEPISLAIHNPHWNDDVAAPIRLGAWGRSGELPSVVGLEAARAGVVRFQWTVPAQAAGGQVFDWRLPPAATTRVVLDLPVEKRPVWEGGLILRTEALPPTSGVGDDPARAPKKDETRAPRGWQRWEMIAASDAQPTLRIVDAKADSAIAAPAPTTTIREALNYEISPRGLTMEAELRLEDAAGPRRQLLIPLPAGVQLVSATVDGREATWRLAADEREAAARAIVELPGPEVGEARTIVLRAWQPLVMNSAWKLPKLRPDDAFWTSGTIRVAVDPLLELRSLDTSDCVQTDTHLSSAGGEPETLTLSQYSPAARVEVLIGPRQPLAKARIGTTLVVGNADVTGRSVTNVDVALGSLHSLSGELPSNWVVDTVETTPSDALGEWYVEDRDGQQRIEIRLTEAIRLDRPISVTLTGRLLPASLSAPLEAATLRMVRWRDAAVAGDLLMVQTVEPYVVESVGELPLVAAESLTDDDRALLPAGADGPVYDMREIADAVTVRLATKKGRYAAEIWLDAALTGDELRQTYHLISRPQTGRVDQILVFVSEKIDGEIRWRETSSDTALNAETVAADDPRRGLLPAEGELWQLHLPSPQASSVEIEATVATPWKSRASVPLMSLPEATDQRGRVLLSIDPQRSPEVEVSNLPAIPLPTEPNAGPGRESGLRLWAAYRYEPAECQNSARQPKLWLAPDSNSAVPSSLIAQRLELESFYSASGEAVHRATYHLENERGEMGEFRLPPGARLTSAIIDGRVLDLPTAPRDERPLTIRLPAGRPTTVSLAFTTSQLPLTQGSQLTPPQLSVEMPILAGEWKIWLPAEFVALDADAIAADRSANWRQRLFGPIGRPADATPFNPFNSDMWSGLLTGWAEETPLVDVASGENASGTRRDSEGVVAHAEGNGGRDRTRGGTIPTAEHNGWRVYRRIFVAGLPEPIVIAHPPATAAWSVAIFLACLVAGSLMRRHPERLVGIAALAAMLGLMLPAAYAPLATGAFLGLLASLAMKWPPRTDPADTPTRTWNRLAPAGASSVAVVLMLLNLAMAQPTKEAVATPPQANRSATIHRVLIPIDAARRPVGTKVHLSEQFFNRLLAESAAGGADQWLLKNVGYEGELRRGSEGEELVAGGWSMTLDVESVGRDTTIRLPLVRNEADWPATALVDGIPMPLEWNADGQSCTVQLAEPGPYRLGISFVPRVQDVAGRNQLALTLPPWRGGEIELRRPAEMQGLEIEGAILQPRDDRTIGSRRGELDESGRLVLRWPRKAASAVPREARITELRWLWIGASGVELDVKYVTPRDARLPQSLAISADSQWELVSDEESIGDISVAAETGRRNRVVISLSPEDRERSEATLRWRLSSPPALGRLRLPPMELVSPQSATSWLAISSEPTVECEIVDAAGVPAETGEEFLTLWGDEELELPQIVLGNVASAPGLAVGTRPRAAESALDELLHVAVGADAVRVQYEAEVVPGRAHRFQFPLTVPADLAIDQVAVVEAGRPIAVRWSRLEAGRVNIFFSEQMTQPYRLSLFGRVPTDGEELCVLPRIASATQSAAMERVQVYRDDDVLVDVEGPANADDAAPDLPPSDWNARLMGAYQVDSATADQVRLAIKPNRAETVGETLTTLSHEEAQWWATFNARLATRVGQLDTLRLRVPANWTGPFDIQPAGASATVAESPDGAGNVLSVRLPESIGVGETLALEIRGPLATGNGATVSVPVVAPEFPGEWRSYLSVPASVQSQDVSWIGEGVRPAEPPENLRSSRANSLPTKTFQAAGSTYRVALAPPQAAQPKASVRLVDTVVLRGPAGHQLVATRFVVAPQGLADAELQLPTGQQLAWANLDGQPARLRRLDEQRWAVSLGAPQLPQILDVVSRDDRHVTSASRRITLQRPTLSADGVPLSVEMSLWSYGQLRITGQPRVEGASLVNSVDQAGLRLDRLASIAEAATPIAMGLPVPDGYDWFRGWSKLLTDAHAAARSATSTSGGASAASQVARSGGEELAPVAARIEIWIERCYDVLGWPDMGPPLDRPGADRERRHWPPTVDGIGGWIHCVAEGGAERIYVELRAEDAPSGLVRLFGVLAIGAVAAATVWLVRHDSARDMMHRWPHAVGVLAGLVWWAWLWPSWLGLVIAAGSLLLLFRSDWPGHSLREDASTVVRVVRPR